MFGKRYLDFLKTALQKTDNEPLLSTGDGVPPLPLYIFKFNEVFEDHPGGVLQGGFDVLYVEGRLGQQRSREKEEKKME